jgi:hypothetical protein
VPDCSFCPTYARGNAKYVALETGMAATTAPVREVVERLIAAGRRAEGDPEILIVHDGGYDVPPVQVLGRLRSCRVVRRATPPRIYDPKGGRPSKHSGEFVFGDPATWGEEQTATVTDTRLYGKATARACYRLDPRLTRRAARLDHDGPLPITEGTGGVRTSRSGCGGRAPAPPKPMSTAAGRHSSAASTSSTPSACSSRHSAGPGPACTTPPPTAGPG